MVLPAIKRSVLSAAKMKRIINFPETSCNLALFALKYSRYANRLGRRGVHFLHLQRGLTIGWKSVRKCKNGR